MPEIKNLSESHKVELEQKIVALQDQVGSLMRIIIEQQKILSEHYRISSILNEFRDQLLKQSDTNLEWAIAERNQALEEAGFDRLSGLSNRQRFLGQAEAIREKIPDCNVAMMFLDNDWFKYINDNFGHDVGDKVIGAIGKAIDETIRGSDFAVKMRSGKEEHTGDAKRNKRVADEMSYQAPSARLGGDEYAILLTGVDDPDHVKEFLKRFKEAVMRETQAIRDSDIKLSRLIISFSIGVAMANWKSYDIDELLRNADMAMLFIKKLKKGKNQACIVQLPVKTDEKEESQNEKGALPDRKKALPRCILLVHNPDIESQIDELDLRGEGGKRK